MTNGEIRCPQQDKAAQLTRPAQAKPDGGEQITPVFTSLEIDLFSEMIPITNSTLLVSDEAKDFEFLKIVRPTPLGSYPNPTDTG
jgi:hypothetical protein